MPLAPPSPLALRATRPNSRQAPKAEFFCPTDEYWRPEQYPSRWEMDDESCDDLRLEQQEFQQILQSCQQRLSPQQLAMFVLRFVEELPAEDICQELAISSSNY